MTNTIKIAVQKKGRLNEQSIAFLNSLGYTFAPAGVELTQKCINANLSLLLVRDDDVPKFVSSGVADFGIVGKNVLEEGTDAVEILKSLAFGVCRLAIAVPKGSSCKCVADLEGERIATTYPRILRAYLLKNGISAAIVPLAGSVEIAPEVNLADAICDIVQSGTTLKAHGLVPIATVMESRAELIASPFVRPQSEAFIKQLALV
jgi:ATP phosphoribosyltransferase